jgi:threonine aldolase
MPKHTVDLRSDTLTQPTAAMRRAMAEAEVGDDVFGEDPTVNRLEALAADTLGKEAGLFVSSGTMANLVSQMAHCGRGDEIILGDQAHTFYHEQGGTAAVAGIHPHTIPNQPDGTLRLEDIEAAIRPDNVHFPVTRLVLLENTHNRCNGAPLDEAYLRSVRALTDRYDLRIHMDGARLFNAAVALGVDAAVLAAEVDSVSICLSKGLGAPVGSVVCGSAAFIARARRVRKVLGGGMRQAGVIAAAGIVALAEMIPQLAEDHANAKKLAQGLAAIDGLALDPDTVRTNIVYFEADRPGLEAQAFLNRLAAEGVKILATGNRQFRAVTHHPLSDGDIDFALRAVARALQ